MLKVIKSGFYTTIQDLGRKGYAQFGVPISGAMDKYSASLANHLLGNNLNDAVIEITFGNAQFQFTKKTLICVSGADFNMQLNNEHVPLNKVIQINANDLLSFSNKKIGVRTYIAVLGGFQSEKLLNSRSFLKGITPNFLLKKNDEIPFKTLKTDKKRAFSSVKFNKNHFSNQKLQCFKGIEFDLLNKHQQEQITTIEFSISNDNSRMGYRLNQVIENNFTSMLTSSVLAGTVQLTPSGKLIVLMRDCQVTGGYPRVLQLTEQAINTLAQKTTGDSFEFEIIPKTPS